MINFLSSWAEQVILAVIIATILELILPNSKNKKYVQMVIGVYVLFNIISPIIKNKEKLVFSEIDLDKYITTSTKVEQSSMDARLEKIYLDELENNIKSKFKNAGIEIIKCTIDAELDTTKKNAGIHSIDVKVKNVDDEKKISKIKQEIIEEYEISEDKIKIIIIEGATKPIVAATAPPTPAILLPTKVAALIPIGPGVICEIVKISTNSFMLSH